MMKMWKGLVLCLTIILVDVGAATTNEDGGMNHHPPDGRTRSLWTRGRMGWQQGQELPQQRSGSYPDRSVFPLFSERPSYHPEHQRRPRPNPNSRPHTRFENKQSYLGVSPYFKTITSNWYICIMHESAPVVWFPTCLILATNSCQVGEPDSSL